MKFSAEFFDVGLIYYDTSTTPMLYKAISVPAYRALMNYYYEAYPIAKIQAHMVYHHRKQCSPLFVLQDRDEQGKLFEKWICKQLMKGADLLLPDLANTVKRPIKIPPLGRMPHQYISVEHINNSSGFINTEIPCLYKSVTSDFPFWDLVIHIPPSNSNAKHELIFIQCSVSPLRVHDKKGSIKQSLNGMRCCE